MLLIDKLRERVYVGMEDELVASLQANKKGKEKEQVLMPADSVRGIVQLVGEERVVLSLPQSCKLAVASIEDFNVRGERARKQ